MRVTQSLASSLDGVRAEVASYQDTVQRLSEAQIDVVRRAGADLEQGGITCEWHLRNSIQILMNADRERWLSGIQSVPMLLHPEHSWSKPSPASKPIAKLALPSARRRSMNHSSRPRSICRLSRLL